MRRLTEMCMAQGTQGQGVQSPHRDTLRHIYYTSFYGLCCHFVVAAHRRTGIPIIAKRYADTMPQPPSRLIPTTSRSASWVWYLACAQVPARP